MSRPQQKSCVTEYRHCGRVFFAAAAQEQDHKSRPLLECLVCGQQPGPGVLVEPPFSNACPGRSLVVKCTVGPLERYTPASLLHVGISDSRGTVVHNFDFGVKATAAAAWGATLAAALPCELTDEQWDELLGCFVRSEHARAVTRPYDSLDNNCFAFAIRWLNLIGFQGMTDHSKDDVAERLVSPLVQRLERHLALQLAARAAGGGLAEAPAMAAAADLPTAAQRPHRFACDGCGHEPLLPGNHFRSVRCPDMDFCLACSRGSELQLLPCAPLPSSAAGPLPPCALCGCALIQNFITGHHDNDKPSPWCAPCVTGRNADRLPDTAALRWHFIYADGTAKRE